MEDVFERGKKGGGGLFKNSKVVVENQFFVVEALTKHAWHAKSQSAATFYLGAMRVFAVTTPSLILCPHPLAKLRELKGKNCKKIFF